MGLIADVASSVFDIAVAVVTRLLADDLKQQMPRLVDRLVDRAVKRLPDEEDRQRYGEEWRSHVAEVSGDLCKVWTALDYLRASRKIACASRRQPAWVVAALDGLAHHGAKFIQRSLLRKLRKQLMAQCSQTQCEFALGGVKLRFEPVLRNILRRRLARFGNYQQLADDVLMEFQKAILDFRRELQHQARAKNGQNPPSF